MKKHYTVIELEVMQDSLSIHNKDTHNKKQINPSDVAYFYITDKKEDMLIKMQQPENDLYLYNNQLNSSKKGQQFKKDLIEWLEHHHVEKK